jgi:hypothetical protein
MNTLDADVMLLQEVEEEELDTLRQENPDLESRYEFHFEAFSEAFWSNWLTDVSENKPKSNGICVALRKGGFTETNIERVAIDPEGAVIPNHARGNFAIVITSMVSVWESKATFVCTHLDADSPMLAAK